MSTAPSSMVRQPNGPPPVSSSAITPAVRPKRLRAASFWCCAWSVWLRASRISITAAWVWACAAKLARATCSICFLAPLSRRATASSLPSAARLKSTTLGPDGMRLSVSCSSRSAAKCSGWATRKARTCGQVNSAGASRLGAGSSALSSPSAKRTHEHTKTPTTQYALAGLGPVGHELLEPLVGQGMLDQALDHVGRNGGAVGPGHRRVGHLARSADRGGQDVGVELVVVVDRLDLADKLHAVRAVVV